MKKLVSLVIIAVSLAVSARALIVGADVGYLTDAKDEYISARIAHEFKSNASLVHQVELEIGYSSQKDSGAKGEFLPFTVNYRAETIPASKLGYYYGVGVGFARTDISFPGSGVPYISDSGTSLAAQAFTGLSYQVSPTATVHLGVKYIWIDDVKLFGTSLDVGDDFAFTLGISARF